MSDSLNLTDYIAENRPDHVVVMTDSSYDHRKSEDTIRIRKILSAREKSRFIIESLTRFDGPHRDKGSFSKLSRTPDSFKLVNLADFQVIDQISNNH